MITNWHVCDGRSDIDGKVARRLTVDRTLVAGLYEVRL